MNRANAKQIATNRIKYCKNYRYFGCNKKSVTHCALSVEQSLGNLYPFPLLPAVRHANTFDNLYDSLFIFNIFYKMR